MIAFIKKVTNNKSQQIQKNIKEFEFLQIAIKNKSIKTSQKRFYNL